MSATTTIEALVGAAPRPPKCRLCGCLLRAVDGDHLEARVCGDCLTRPEGKRLLAAHGSNGNGHAPSPAAATPRDFTPAEKGLIKSLHGHLPIGELLRILNDRLVADLGQNARPHTIEALHAELQAIAPPTSTQYAGWTGLRQVLAAARRCGVLAEVNAQVLDDFSVVFQLAPAQHMALKDVVRAAQQE